jgi:hypothetical protein
MKLCSRKIIAQFILAAYILAGVLLEVGHHDAHNMVLDSTPVLSSHECGATEIHIPLDKRHDCLACTQSTLRLATTAICISVSSILFFSPARPQDQTANPLDIDVVHSGKRGPPPFFA